GAAPQTRAVRFPGRAVRASVRPGAGRAHGGPRRPGTHRGRRRGDEPADPGPRGRSGRATGWRAPRRSRTGGGAMEGVSRLKGGRVAGRANSAPAGRVRALAAVELRRMMRAPGTLVGVVGFLILLAVGHWSYWTTLPPRPEDDRLFVWAYIVAMCGMLRFGLAEDRELAIDEYLVPNLISPLRYALSKLLATTAMLGVFGAGAFACAAAASAADLQYAAWYTVLMTLVVWMLLPALLLVEICIDTRYPALFVLLAFVATLIVGRLMLGPVAIVRLLGLDV